MIADHAITTPPFDSPRKDPSAGFDHTISVYVKADTYAVCIDAPGKWCAEALSLRDALLSARDLVERIFAYEQAPPSPTNRNPNRRAPISNVDLPDRTPDAVVRLTADHRENTAWFASLEGESCWATTEETLHYCMAAVTKRLQTTLANVPRVIEALALRPAPQQSMSLVPAGQPLPPATKFRTVNVDQLLTDEIAAIAGEAEKLTESIKQLTLQRARLRRERVAVEKTRAVYRKARQP